MKLRKDKWKEYKIAQVAEVISGGTPSTIVDEYFGGDIVWLTPTEIPKERIKELHNSSETITELGLKKSSAKLLPKGTVLLTSRATIGLIAIAGKPLTTNQGFANFICNETYLRNKFFAYWLQAKTDEIKSLSTGTTFKEISKSTIRNLSIYLPTLDEQNKISLLFEQLEETIDEIDIQEQSLKNLQQYLSNGLTCETPSFGDLLSGKKTTNTTFGSITDCIENHDKQKDGISYFVGLENIQTDNFNIDSWGKVSDGTTFTKTFSKGDILFGKRRSYLRKVAIAPFNGICSSDILVFRAKPDQILPELLPFYVLSDHFINHAINTSAGSLSPRTKWKDLAPFKLSIPGLEIQKKILAILKQILSTRQLLCDQKTSLEYLKIKLHDQIFD